jgi:peptidyl-tRNA hydrolase ICT1
MKPISRTSSKATLTWSLESVKPYVPRILHSELHKSKFYVESSDSLQISAQTSRRQQENKDECQEKLYELLKVITKDCIPGETSEVKKQRIERL